MSSDIDGRQIYSEIPQGLSMSLAKDVEALDYFCSLTGSEREAIVQYIQGSVTGDDAKARIENTISNLKQHKTNFSAY